MLSYMIPLLTAPPQVPSLRFASGVPQGRRRVFGWHKSHPHAPPCVLRAGNRLLHPLIASRNFAAGTALCGNMRPYEMGVSTPSRASPFAAFIGLGRASGGGQSVADVKIMVVAEV